MPDILRVRFLGDAEVDVPIAGRRVAPDTVFELPARVVQDDEAADHVVIELGNPPDTRLLQRALFRVENPPKARARKED